MKEFKYKIKDKLGIHARPAGLLVKCVKESGASVTITKENNSVDASKLLAVMGMGIKFGNEVTVSIDGESQDIALEKIKTFFEENL